LNSPLWHAGKAALPLGKDWTSGVIWVIHTRLLCLFSLSDHRLSIDGQAPYKLNLSTNHGEGVLQITLRDKGPSKNFLQKGAW